MRPLLVAAAAAVAFASGPRAQDADTLTAADGWRSSLTASLSGTQASYSQWSEGGLDALAVSASAEGLFERVLGRVVLRHSGRLALGVLKQDTLDVRKAEDVIRYEASAALGAGRTVRPVLAVSARTQFAPGFDYAPKAEDYPTLPVMARTRLKVSDLASPLRLTQSAGVSVHPGPDTSARIGLGLKETIVVIERLRPVYGNAPGEPVRLQAGLDAEAQTERPLAENVLLRARATAFQSFGQLGTVAPDVTLETGVVMKVNRLLNVTLDAAAVYDADVRDAVQLKEVLAVGLTFVVL